MGLKPDNAKKRREHVLATVVILGVVIAGVLAVVFSDPFGHRGGGANQLDEEVWDELREVPQDRILFRETRNLAAGIEAPSCIAVGANDVLYIGGRNAIRVLDAAGQVLREWSIERPARAVAIDQSERVYVGTDRLEVYSEDGEKLLESEPFPGRAIITSVAVGHDTVYVADAGNAAICRMTAQGDILGWIGRDPTTQQGEAFVIRSPHLDVAVDGNEKLWVAHAGRWRVEKRTPDGTLETYWGTGMQYGQKDLAAFSGCCNPTDIALAPNQTVITAEKAIERIKVYGRDGEFMGVVAPPADFVQGTPNLDLACDSRGRVHAMDPVQERVLTYEAKSGREDL